MLDPVLAVGDAIYHWFCCNCIDGLHSFDPTRESAFIGVDDICECSHLRCPSCRVEKARGLDLQGVASSNLLDKFGSNFNIPSPSKDHLHAWSCCFCIDGLTSLIDPDAAKSDIWQEKCPNPECAHEKCVNCLTYTSNNKKDSFTWQPSDSVPRGALENVDQSVFASGYLWVENANGSLEINPLVLSEKQLPEFKRMDTDSLELTQFGPSQKLLQRLSAPVAHSPIPNTPELIDSSTRSSTESPKPVTNHDLETETELVIKSLIESKKAIYCENFKKAKRRISQGIDANGSMFDPEIFSFLIAYEHALLPFLIDLMPSWHGPGFTISMRQGKEPNSKVVSIMTETEISVLQKIEIEKHTLDLLPPNFHKSTSMKFQIGTIRRSGNEYDNICRPKNPHYYEQPTMGDSIGIALGQGDDDSTSTLGPCIMILNSPYWLMNFHPLDHASKHNNGKPLGLMIEHPSPADKAAIIKSAAPTRPSNMEIPSYDLGSVVACCGNNLRTTRSSKNLYWHQLGLDPPEIVVDWALCSARAAFPNALRRPLVSGDDPNKTILSTGRVMGGASVCSTGRTSGYQHGQVCLSPMAVSGKMNGTGKMTREWYIEEPYPYDNESGWIESGIGISGDSGAGIVDKDTNVLYGQLWGRNEYLKSNPGPRQTFFTPIEDIFDDIGDKFSNGNIPKLPKHAAGDAPDTRVPSTQVCVCHQAIHCTDPSSMGSPGIDITRQNNSVTTAPGMTTPMANLMMSEDSTPPEEELLTPVTIRSPECYRERLIEFDHIGIGTISPLESVTTSCGYSNISTPCILEHSTPYANEINSDDCVGSESDTSCGRMKRKIPLNDEGKHYVAHKKLKTT